MNSKNIYGLAKSDEIYNTILAIPGEKLIAISDVDNACSLEAVVSINGHVLMGEKSTGNLQCNKNNENLLRKFLCRIMQSENSNGIVIRSILDDASKNPHPRMCVYGIKIINKEFVFLDSSQIKKADTHDVCGKRLKKQEDDCYTTYGDIKKYYEIALKKMTSDIFEKGCSNEICN